MDKADLKRMLLTIAFSQADNWSVANDALRDAWHDIAKMPWSEDNR